MCWNAKSVALANFALERSCRTYVEEQTRALKHHKFMTPQTLFLATSSRQQFYCQHVDGSTQQRTLTSVDGRNFILLDETSNVRPMPRDVPESVTMIETLGRSSNQTYRQQCRIKNAWGCEIGHCAVSAGNTALNLAERMNFCLPKSRVFPRWKYLSSAQKGKSQRYRLSLVNST